LGRGIRSPTKKVKIGMDHIRVYEGKQFFRKGEERDEEIGWRGGVRVGKGGGRQREEGDKG